MGKKSNRLTERVRRLKEQREANNNDTLSEFSDSSNDFYVDEIKERRRERTEERRERKQVKKKEKQQRPMTPTGRKIIRIVSFITILTVILVVGVVLSLTAEAAGPLLEKCKPLADGYYDVSGLTLTVRLDPPEGIDPKDWATVQWAYGGGLTLIRDGVGLCDGEHMEAWFDTEGWTSPLSRQTQESNLHSLVKHPRTAIGCTADGSLVVLVYSGRTWRSTGADYREMITIARQLYPDIHFLMNCDGGGSAMLGMVQNGSFLELSFPSTSSGSCAGQVRPVNTVFYMPIQEKGESQ